MASACKGIGDAGIGGDEVNTTASVLVAATQVQVVVEVQFSTITLHVLH